MTPATYTAILPIALLLIVFLLKLFVGKSCNMLDVWRAAMEVPVDISIFGVSTLISVVLLIGNGADLSEAVCALLIFFALKIVSIFIWRVSLAAIERGGLEVWGTVSVVFGTGLNFFMTVGMALYSVSLLVSKQHVGA